MTSITAEKLAKLGANIIITPTARISPLALERLAGICKEKRGHLTVHAGKYSAATLENCARIAGRNFTISM